MIIYLRIYVEAVMHLLEWRVNKDIDLKNNIEQFKIQKVT
jgi:hypothetical protein